MNRSSALYILAVLILQILAVNAPHYLTGTFEGLGYPSLIFLAGFFGAMLSIAWRGVRPLQPFWVLPLVLIFVPASMYGVNALKGLLGDAMPWGDIPFFRGTFFSFLVQVFTSTIVMAGIWIRGRTERFIVRRAADDEEELEKLFELKQRIMPEDGLTFFKFKTTMSRGLCLNAVVRNRIFGFFRAVRFLDEVFLYDLVVDAGEHSDAIRRRLILEMLHRYELHGAELIVVMQPDEAALEIFQEIGFEKLPVTDADPDSILEWRARISKPLREKFPEWEPYSNIKIFMRAKSPAPVPEPEVATEAG